ncbi:hypothetical protein EON67_03145 [archaeon]|nr:MAG: hypothetical protein EON67_03145 [archaeon]
MCAGERNGNPSTRAHAREGSTSAGARTCSKRLDWSVSLRALSESSNTFIFAFRMAFLAVEAPFLPAPTAAAPPSAAALAAEPLRPFPSVAMLRAHATV